VLRQQESAVGDNNIGTAGNLPDLARVISNAPPKDGSATQLRAPRAVQQGRADRAAVVRRLPDSGVVSHEGSATTPTLRRVCSCRRAATGPVHLADVGEVVGVGTAVDARRQRIIVRSSPTSVRYSRQWFPQVHRTSYWRSFTSASIRTPVRFRQPVATALMPGDRREACRDVGRD
jgi:hypothetical protein